MGGVELPARHRHSEELASVASKVCLKAAINDSRSPRSTTGSFCTVRQMRVQPTSSAVADDVPSRQLDTKRGKAETAAIFAVLALYVAFLLKLLLFSRAPGSERSPNLVPFATIRQYAFGHSSGTRRIAFANVVGNVLVFIPLGFYVSWLQRRVSPWLTLLTVGMVSVAVEICQGVFAVGATDIDDVILNCVGGAIGTVAFRLLHAIMRDGSRVQSAMAALSLLTMPVWCFFLFIIRLRVHV